MYGKEDSKRNFQKSEIFARDQANGPSDFFKERGFNPKNVSTVPTDRTFDFKDLDRMNKM